MLTFLQVWRSHKSRRNDHSCAGARPVGTFSRTNPRNVKGWLQWTGFWRFCQFWHQPINWTHSYAFFSLGRGGQGKGEEEDLMYLGSELLSITSDPQPMEKKLNLWKLSCIEILKSWMQRECNWNSIEFKSNSIQLKS